MTKLEQISYDDTGRRGPNILLMKTDALTFRRVADEQNLTYTIRRIA